MLSSCISIFIPQNGELAEHLSDFALVYQAVISLMY